MFKNTTISVLKHCEISEIKKIVECEGGNVLSKPKILFIGTSFFNIENKIIKSFENNGYEVDYYNDRPSNASIIKGLIKVNKKISRPINDMYFQKILKETKKNCYQKVFILNGKIMNKKMISKLKEQHNNSEFIFYTYDSLRLYPTTIETLEMYDRIYSFDTKDVEKYKFITLLPLFFDEDIKNITSSSEYEYDILSICTAHPNRYNVIRKIFPQLELSGLNIYSFLYLNKLQFIYNKLFVSEFKNSSKTEFNFNSLSNQDILNLISRSKSIFDVEHKEQSGLTMRTIETLGSRRKLITTNKEIKKYNFFSEKNILVFSEKLTTNEIKDFLNEPFEPLNSNIYNQYHIDKWSKIILGIENVEEYLL